MTIATKLGRAGAADANIKKDIESLQSTIEKCTKAAMTLARSGKDPAPILAIKAAAQMSIDEATIALARLAAGKSPVRKAGLLDTIAAMGSGSNAVKIAAAAATPTALPQPNAEQIKAAGGGMEGYMKAARTLQREAQAQEST